MFTVQILKKCNGIVFSSIKLPFTVSIKEENNFARRKRLFDGYVFSLSLCVYARLTLNLQFVLRRDTPIIIEMCNYLDFSVPIGVA